jgi:hypothetical protein
MPGKAGAMRFYRAIFPTGLGQSANNLSQVIYFTLLNKALPLRRNAFDTLPNTTGTDAMHKTVPRKV